MANTLQDEQAPIDMEIVQSLIECTPEDWMDFSLTIEYVWPDDPDALGSVKHMLTSNEGKNDLVTPSENVFNAVQKLNKLFHKFGVSWLSAVYRVRYSEDSDKWSYEADFQY